MSEPKHGGCYICGSKEEAVLTSKTVQGMNVALCSKHVHATTLPPKGVAV